MARGRVLLVCGADLGRLRSASTRCWALAPGLSLPDTAAFGEEVCSSTGALVAPFTFQMPHREYQGRIVTLRNVLSSS